MRPSLPLLALPTALLAGCSGDPTLGHRAAWLQQALVDENLYWMNRDPALLADKYARMARDPYDFMRGTAGVFLLDLARPGTERTATAFLGSRDAAEVLLVGDPHPENIGTTRVQGTSRITLEVVDLDGAAYGPWILDLRRAAVGIGVLSTSLGACGDVCQEQAVVALARGYLEGLEDPEGVDPQAEDTGPMPKRRVEEATEEGLERKRLEQSTVLHEDGSRSFLFDEALSPEGAGVLPLDEADAAQLERLLERYAELPQAPAGMRVLDTGRRYGTGVASLPAPRYVVLYDRGDEGPDDDGMFELREIRDPPELPFLVNPTPGLWEDNGDRLVSASEEVWSRTLADPRYAGPCDGELCFRAATWSSWYQEIDHIKAWEEWSVGDSTAFAGMALCMGRVVGRAHGQGRTLQGEPTGEVVLLDIELGGGVEALQDELWSHYQADLAQQEVDYALFLELLASEGPLLGVQDLSELTL